VTFFDPPRSKSTGVFVGNLIFIGSFIGVDFGVEKWGSFCRKLQNFKKFCFGGPGSPRSIFDDFDPPMAYQFLSTFGTIFDKFITSLFDPHF
jgi:hypothetical protein